MNDDQKSLVLRTANSIGAQLGKPVSREQIDNFLRLMHPVDPGMEKMRLGPSTDGGYVIPSDLDGIKACFSPGVCDESGFEEDCLRLGLRTHLADASVDTPEIVKQGATFEKKFVGSYTDGQQLVAMDDWVQLYEPNTDELLLQIDIEGAEYEVIHSMKAATMQRFRIIVMELHFLNEIFDRHVYFLIMSALRKLNHSHAVVHLHPNTATGYVKQHGITMPRLLEITYLRRDRIKDFAYAKSLSSPHDCPNSESTPGFSLGDEWLKGG